MHLIIFSVVATPQEHSWTMFSMRDLYFSKPRAGLRALWLYFLAGIKSDMVITARNLKALEETKTLIVSNAPGITVHIVTGDLGNMESLPELCTKLVDIIDTSKHQQGVLVHNAATMNEFVPFLSQTDPKKIQAYLGINVTSMIVLTTRFLSAFPSGRHYVVHITAILATVYCKWYSLSTALLNLPGLDSWDHSVKNCLISDSLITALGLLTLTCLKKYRQINFQSTVNLFKC